MRRVGMKAAGGGRVDRLGQLCHVVNLFDGLLDIIAKKLVSNWHRLVAQRLVSSVDTGSHDLSSSLRHIEKCIAKHSDCLLTARC